MRAFDLGAITVTWFAICVARSQSQQPIDPAYLREYYSAQQGRGPAPDATPIYEHDNSQHSQPQYVQQGQQIRIKDSISDRVTFGHSCPSERAIAERVSWSEALA